MNNRNSKLTRELIDACSGNSLESIPMQINNSIIPTVEVNPRLTQTMEMASVDSTSTSVDILTVANNGRTILYDFTYSYDVTVAGTNTKVYIECTTENGDVRVIVKTIKPTASAQRSNIFGNISKGIVLKKGSKVQFKTDNATGFTGFAAIYYVVENEQ